MTNLVHTGIQTDSRPLIRNIPGLEFWTSETHLPTLKRYGRSADVTYSITTQVKDTDFFNDVLIRLAYLHAFPRSIPNDNATNKQDTPDEMEIGLYDSINRVFNDAKDETFYDGFDSHFSESISQFILDFGVPAVLVIGKILESNFRASETAEETLRQMGKIVDKRTHTTRLALLLRKLSSPNPRIRDAASIGIASLDDPAAIPLLQRAVETEQSAWVRTNLALTLKQILEDI